ncbi:MAG: 50S ribosomal protein L9 [Chthoniobacterales bacterium]|jgi:large subunit ribosomal protein L9|nr:50S ribosomal protein L9 [Chthoniobacterales bacterium]
MPQTEVILTTLVPGLGAEADIVKVRRGYARNLLIPRGMAHEITPGALRMTNSLKARRAEREARELNEAEELGRRLSKAKLSFVLETGDSGKAFGAVTAKDIAEKLKAETGHEVDRHRIALERPIKESGDFTVDLRLHSEVHAKLKISVTAKTPAATAEGAEDSEGRQSRVRRAPKKETAESGEA